jgi:hypothetical protein
VKMGIVLPSFLYNDKRKQLADQTFRSLAKTEPRMESTRLLLLVRSPHEYTTYVELLKDKFNIILKTDEGLTGTEQTLAFGTTWLWENYDLDVITWMGDDALFNPFWLWKLEELIQRHPGARSWSVYRSSFEWFHRTLDEAGEDVSVRSICGHGLTMTKQEWTEWGIDWKVGAWGCPYGDTLDLVHMHEREGERWVTKQSFLEHTGKEGVHATVDTPEYARNFVAV